MNELVEKKIREIAWRQGLEAEGERHRRMAAGEMADWLMRRVCMTCGFPVRANPGDEPTACRCWYPTAAELDETLTRAEFLSREK